MKNKKNSKTNWQKSLNKKYEQKIKLLSVNDMFIETLENAKKHHALVIKRYKKLFKDLLVFLENQILKVDLNDELSLDRIRKEFELKEKPVLKIRKNKSLIKDCINISKKIKLYPAEKWADVIISVLLDDNSNSLYDKLVYHNPYFIRASRWGMGILQNCDARFIINPATKEREIILRIYPDTSIGDVKVSWPYVMKLQSILKNDYKVKRFYPLKTIKIWEKLRQLDKGPSSDYEKQEEIYGPAINEDWGPTENKRRDNIKQIRHRYRKR